MKFLLLVVLWLPLAVSAATAFVAVPDSINGEAIVDATERLANQVKITQNGSQFYWASNQNAPLTRMFRGDKIVFVALGGEGMVVIWNQANLPEEQRQGDGRPFLYCEHFRDAIQMKSYCGGSQEVAVSAQ